MLKSSFRNYLYIEETTLSSTLNFFVSFALTLLVIKFILTQSYQHVNINFTLNFPMTNWFLYEYRLQ